MHLYSLTEPPKNISLNSFIEKFHFVHAAGTERLFSRLFKANIQIDGFYLLLKGEESITPVATGEVAKFYPGVHHSRGYWRGS